MFEKVQPVKTGSYLYKQILTFLVDKDDDLNHFNPGTNLFSCVHKYKIESMFGCSLKLDYNTFF
jgi:hypothetical protein